MPNSIEVWQTFRDAWSESVIFGESDPEEALTCGRRQRSTSSSPRAEAAAMAVTATAPVPGAGSFDPASAADRDRIPLRQQLVGYLFVSP